MEFELTQDVAAPPEVVWDVLTDVDGGPRFLSSLKAVRWLSEPGYEVGSRWVETRLHRGREMEMELSVEAAERPERVTVVSPMYGMRHEADITVTPLEGGAGGSRIRQAFTVTPGPGQGRLKAAVLTTLMMIGTKQAKAMMEQDLADIAVEAERRARD